MGRGQVLAFDAYDDPPVIASVPGGRRPLTASEERLVLNCLGRPARTALTSPARDGSNDFQAKIAVYRSPDSLRFVRDNADLRSKAGSSSQMPCASRTLRVTT